MRRRAARRGGATARTDWRRPRASDPPRSPRRSKARGRDLFLGERLVGAARRRGRRPRRTPRGSNAPPPRSLRSSDRPAPDPRSRLGVRLRPRLRDPPSARATRSARRRDGVTAEVLCPARRRLETERARDPIAIDAGLGERCVWIPEAVWTTCSARRRARYAAAISRNSRSPDEARARRRRSPSRVPRTRRRARGRPNELEGLDEELGLADPTRRDLNRGPGRPRLGARSACEAGTSRSDRGDDCGAR